MTCFLCGSHKAKLIGRCRDNHNIRVMLCECGLVYLDPIQEKNYLDDSMEESTPRSVVVPTMAEANNERRLEYCRTLFFSNTMNILDYGPGQGMFLKTLKENGLYRLYSYETCISCHKNLDKISIRIGDIKKTELKFDLITMFHVIEHVLNPVELLNNIHDILAPGGKLVIETPSAEDALITLYDCEAFKKFTYWSYHPYLYNVKTMNTLMSKTKFGKSDCGQVQLYPMSNHMYWLRYGKPNGHLVYWTLSDLELTRRYTELLKEKSMCDTLMMTVGK